MFNATPTASLRACYRVRLAAGVALNVGDDANREQYKLHDSLDTSKAHSNSTVSARLTSIVVRSNHMAHTSYGEVSWERMIRAVENVRNRVIRAAAALEAASVPYAVAGGNAVAAWVSRVDEAAVRNTRDVDILLRRTDLASAREALEKAGFVYRHVKNIDMFLDGEGAKARDAVHIVFANEKVRDRDLAALPDVDDSEPGDQFRVVTLESLVRMKLTSYRDKDRTHLRDLIDLELLDQTWCDRFQPELASRLQELIDDPDG